MAWEDVAKSAGTGASIGGTVGSIIPGVGTAIGTGIGGLIGGVGSAILGRGQNKETPVQGQQRQLIDQLLASIGGQGPYSDLFNLDENAFQKSFVDPMKQKFQSQIAPQLQQSYIASGQQRGTGLDDTLTRAGVDIDQLLNQFYSQQQQGAMNRKAVAMSGILNQGAGVGPGQTVGEAALSGLGGYLGSEGFSTSLNDIISAFSNQKPNQNMINKTLQDQILPKRKGFETQPQVYNPYTGVQQ